MPRYEYTCAVCGAKDARIVSIAHRDDQTCDAQKPPESLRKLRARRETCGGKLTREEIPLTAYTPGNWKP